MPNSAGSALDYPVPELFIAGEWPGGAPGPDHPGEPAFVVDPATGRRLAAVPWAGPELVQAAIDAAGAAFAAWARLPAPERGEVLRRAADELTATRERDALVMTLEQGKTLAESRAEMDSIIDLLRWYADRATDAAERPERGSGAGVDVGVGRAPIGPVAILTPWNFPASLAARKLAAALAVGCTAIVKPAAETPASFLSVARALAAAGLPDGVLSVVNGDPARICRELIASPTVRAVSFTGSTQVGREVALLAAQHIKPATLELGGHAPVIVAADADVSSAVQSLAVAKYRNAGQVCLSPTRFLVHEDLHARFVDEFVAYAGSVRVGAGVQPDAQMGPLAVERRRRAVVELIDRTVAAGARIECGGAALPGAGWFMAPTVLTNAPISSAAMNEEPFGPVALINSYRTDAEAIAEANRLPVGLGAYVFTTSTQRARHLVDSLEAGTVGVNTAAIVHAGSPLGGVKDSGYGSDGGLEGMHEFQYVKSVSRTGLS